MKEEIYWSCLELSFSLYWFRCGTFRRSVALVRVTCCTIRNKCDSSQKKLSFVFRIHVA